MSKTYQGGEKSSGKMPGGRHRTVRHGGSMRDCSTASHKTYAPPRHGTTTGKKGGTKGLGPKTT